MVELSISRLAFQGRLPRRLHAIPSTCGIQLQLLPIVVIGHSLQNMLARSLEQIVETLQVRLP